MRLRLPLFFHSIRFRLALWFSLVLALVLFVFGSFIYFRELQAVHTDADIRLATRLRQFDETVLRPMRYQHEENEDAPPLTAATFALIEYEAAVVTGPTGEIDQYSGSLTAEQAAHVVDLAAQTPPSGLQRERIFACQIQAAGEDDPVAYIFAAIPLPGEGAGSADGPFFILGRPVDADNRMPRLLVTLLLGAAATLLVAAGGGIWLAGRALRPVQTITRTAQSISENDLHRRLNLGSRDELGELARTFDGMLDRLQAAFDRQRRFTADASHELRTPLSILTLESERALESKRSSEEYRRVLEIVRSESGFMARLVEELLLLARMDSGANHFKKEGLDLSDVVLDAVERYMPLAARKGVRLRTGELPELPVRGDRSALGQMVGNLIDNALKYTPAGEDRWARVEAGERLENGRLLAWLRVSDSGPGIPEAALPHLFERFYRADEARSRNPDENDEIPGSGLGLSIVQRVAELHGGSVRARNLPAGGAEFEVSLPVQRENL